MYKSRKNVVIYVGKSASRKFDTFESANFSLNEFGWIRGDFSELVAQNDILGYVNAANRMEQIQVDENGIDLSFDELVARVRPRWMQSLTEKKAFEDYLLSVETDRYSVLLDKYNAQRAKEDEEAKIKQDEAIAAYIKSHPDVVSNKND